MVGNAHPTRKTLSKTGYSKKPPFLRGVGGIIPVFCKKSTGLNTV
jgi:hypothetical protein